MSTNNESKSINPKYYFADDEFITWFECTNCKCNRIVYKSNYCPKCGEKLIWLNEEDGVKDLIND